MVSLLLQGFGVLFLPSVCALNFKVLALVWSSATVRHASCGATEENGRYSVARINT
jgi:hypothetical protein